MPASKRSGLPRPTREIYLDHAAATPVDPAVVREIVRGMRIIGNPSSFNNAGRAAARELVAARQTVARFLNAHSDEIVFTSSGSESNTLAIIGVVSTIGRKKIEIISQPTEHLSVLKSLIDLKKKGHAVRMAPVSGEGIVSPSEIEKSLSSRTMLVSIMYANNEIGAIQPIVEIGKIIKAFRRKNHSPFPLFHTDACQAAAYLPMDVNRLGVDLLTFNGSKIYGPRGVGVVYVRRGVEISPIIFGGGQERGRRAGTENLPAILGLAKAVSLVDPKRDTQKLSALRDYFFKRLGDMLPKSQINGPSGKKRLANNINISIPGSESERLLLELDKHGIRAGSGSACTAHSVEPSHVLKAIGVRRLYLDGALRFSLGRDTTKRDIEYLLNVLSDIVSQVLRK